MKTHIQIPSLTRARLAKLSVLFQTCWPILVTFVCFPWINARIFLFIPSLSHFQHFISINLSFMLLFFGTACRVQCNYPGKTITFHVDSGSNSNYFASLIEYGDGDGDLGTVELKQALDGDSWRPMQQSWGAVWKLDAGTALTAPFSIRLTSGESGETIVANSVIPAGWTPGQTYRSVVNFWFIKN